MYFFTKKNEEATWQCCTGFAELDIAWHLDNNMDVELISDGEAGPDTDIDDGDDLDAMQNLDAIQRGDQEEAEFEQMQADFEWAQSVIYGVAFSDELAAIADIAES